MYVFRSIGLSRAPKRTALVVDQVVPSLPGRAIPTHDGGTKMIRLGILRVIAIVFCVLVLTNGTAVAQTSRGTLTGVITDPSGAAIATATVTVANCCQNRAMRVSKGPLSVSKGH